MYQKIIINILLLIALAMFQAGFISSLPPPANSLNVITVVLVWLLSLSSFRTVVWWSAGLGIIFDLYSFLPFGAHLVSLLGTIVIVRWLLLNFFTNRSLYTYLALTFFATLFYEISRYAVIAAVYFVQSSQSGLNINQYFWKHEIYLFGLNLACVVAIFYFYGYLSQKLKPVFLFRSKP